LTSGKGESHSGIIDKTSGKNEQTNRLVGLSNDKEKYTSDQALSNNALACFSSSSNG
jgi:hypothetical protein